MTPSRRAFWRVVWAPGWTGSRHLPTCPTRRPDTPPDPLQTPSRELGLTPSREGTFEAFSGLPKVHVFGQLFGSFWRLIFAKKNAKKSAKKSAKLCSLFGSIFDAKCSSVFGRKVVARDIVATLWAVWQLFDLFLGLISRQIMGPKTGSNLVDFRGLVSPRFWVPCNKFIILVYSFITRTRFWGVV